MVDFCIDFFSILAQFWEPSWSHVGHFFAQNTGGLTEGRGLDGLLALKTAPRRPQDRPKTPPGGLLEPLWRPLDAPSALRSPHDAPRSRFWSLQTSILEPVDLDFGASEPRFWRFSTSELIYNII